MRRLISIALLALTCPVFAQSVKDNPKCEANPVFNRFPSESLEKCERLRFKELDLTRWKQPGNAKSGTESFKVAGEYWNYFNNLGKDDSGRAFGKLEVQRDIEAAVIQAKGEVLYLGSGRVTFRLRKGADEFWGESGCGRGGDDCSAVSHKIVRLTGTAPVAGGEGAPVLAPTAAMLSTLKGAAGGSLTGKVMQWPGDRRAALTNFIAQSEEGMRSKPSSGPVMFVGRLAGYDDFDVLGQGRKLGPVRDIAFLSEGQDTFLVMIARREDTGQDYFCPLAFPEIATAIGFAEKLRKSNARIYCLEGAEAVTPDVRKLIGEIWAGLFGYDSQKVFAIGNPVLIFRGL